MVNLVNYKKKDILKQILKTKVLQSFIIKSVVYAFKLNKLDEKMFFQVYKEFLESNHGKEEFKKLDFKEKCQIKLLK